jgi:hypothetical protein
MGVEGIAVAKWGASMEFSSLRERYPTFAYEGFHTDETAERLTIVYDFSIEGLAEFHPAWAFPHPERFVNRDPGVLRNLAFHLGMAELVSYWKPTCSPRVAIRAGKLTDAQAAWWKKLYFYGLGEFLYVNGARVDLDALMTIDSSGEAPGDGGGDPPPRLRGSLIPVGGGKDSIVTLDLLKGSRAENLCYMVNQTAARIGSAAAAGYGEAQIIVARRTLDPAMLALNRRGFLNGHTPLSAVIAFSGVLAAYLYGKERVVLSNESSANESTVSDAEVNHQYSKSYAFERDFDAYLAAHMRFGIRYFSLLRPFCELQIAEHFAGLPAFHKVFNSCNLGSKFDGWCLDCPKCLFIYLILSPFLSQARLMEIFGANLLDQAKFAGDFEKLTGIQENKPFECVGSREEANQACVLAAERILAAGEEMPLLLREHMRRPLFARYRAHPFAYRKHFDRQHLIPPAFLEILARSDLYDKEAR